MGMVDDLIYGRQGSGSEAVRRELAAQQAMSPRTRAAYYEGAEMPADPRMAGYRMGSTADQTSYGQDDGYMDKFMRFFLPNSYGAPARGAPNPYTPPLWRDQRNPDDPLFRRR